MENGLHDKRSKNAFTMRSVVDYTMGVIYLAASYAFIFAEKIGLNMISFPKSFRYVFGGICAVYGAWRIYRGYRKDYY